MRVTPVINLAGNCEEAIRYYEYVFSTKADFILHYSDADPRDWKKPLTDREKGFVYHAEMRIGDQRFMFSDILEFEIMKGNSFFTVVTLDTGEEVRRIYDRMIPEGEIVSPLKRTTYSSCTVNLIDKFGIRWGLMTEQTER